MIAPWLFGIIARSLCLRVHQKIQILKSVTIVENEDMTFDFLNFKSQKRQLNKQTKKEKECRSSFVVRRVESTMVLFELACLVMDDGDEAPIFCRQLSRVEIWTPMKMTYKKSCCLRMVRFIIYYYYGILMLDMMCDVDHFER